MRMLIFIFVSFIQNAVLAQVSTSFDVRSPAQHGYGSIEYNNPSDLGKTIDVIVSDDEIRGNPFWKSDWNKAYVFLTSGSVARLNQAKLNLKTNEVYFLDSSNHIKATDANTVSKIIFVDRKDSAKTLAVFQKLNYDGSVFFQVLNAGDYQLLKTTIVAVIKKDYNTLLGKDEYAYDSKPVYYVFNEGQLSKIDILNKEHLSALIYFSDEDKKWLVQNKNKLKANLSG